MTVGMRNPLDKMIRIRSLGEVMTRGGQAISAYRDQRGAEPQLPTDEEFEALMDPQQFASAPVIAESLWQKFYSNGEKLFFPTFETQRASTAVFKETFRGPACTRFINAAEN